MVFRASAFPAVSGASPCGAPHSRAPAFSRKCGGLPASAALLALAACTLGACSSSTQSGGSAGVGGIPGIGGSSGPASVGLILPLSGPHAAIGLRMRDAATLALSTQGSPPLDVRDSAGTGGASQAMHDALEHGDAIVLGPLTTAETAEAAPLAVEAGIPELAFTSDASLTRPGVWVMGLTPEQQVRRMTDAARAIGRKSFAAFLPDNALGHAMADGLTRACQDAGLAAPRIAFHASDPAGINDGIDALTDIAIRKPSPAPADAPPAVPEGPSAVDPTAPPPSAAPAVAAPPPAVPPPPFDALVLADTGLELAQVITRLQADHVESTQVQVMGPALWKAFDGKLGALHGAWYAAPDARDRLGYVARYRAVYHQAPSPVTDFAYDAAALAGALMKGGKPTVEELTRPQGYAGVDGLFRLLPDGRVTRALAIFQIQPGGGARIIVPASRDIAAPRPS